MNKYNINNFKVNDIVICVNNVDHYIFRNINKEVIHSTINIGSVYKVNHSAKYFISLYNDDNMLGSYDYKHFILLSEYRVNIIDEIIGK